MGRTQLAALVLASLPLAVPAQTMFKCVAEGKTVYQAEPCPDSAKQGTLDAPPPGPAARGDTKAKAGEPARASAGADDATIGTLAGYQACSEAVTEWDPTHRAAFDAWKSRNAAAVARTESDPESKRKYAERLQAGRTGTVRTCVAVLDVIKPDRDRDFLKKAKAASASDKPR